MAQFRLSAAIVSRSSGKSVVAAAAYRAAQKLLDERTGDVKDYSRKRGVLYSEILTPDNAPAWMLDRQQLWNEVERREDQSTRRNQAQLARDIELSLPHELTHEQRVELLREFVKAEFVDHGMVADIALHAPPKRGDGTNHHAHILLTMRRIENGGFGDKNRDWNHKAQIEHWRERWAECQNRALEKYGHDARVDHRSLEDQGIDREPTQHLGPAAQAMEDKGIPTDRGDENRERLAANDNLEKLKAELADIDRQIAALERIKKVVAAVERGYERVEQGAERAPQGRKIEKPSPQSYAGGPEAAPMPDSGSPADKAASDARTKEQQRQDEARKDQEAKEEQARVAEEKRLAELAQQHRDKLAAQAEQMRQEQERLKPYRDAQERLNLWLDAQQKTALDARRAEEKQRKEEHEKAPEGYIRNPGTRYAQALRDYDVRNPYQSLAKAAMAEHAIFRTEQDTLSRQIAATADPKERQALELRKKIEGYEYLAITGDRIAAQTYIITGRADHPDRVKMQGNVATYRDQAKELREQYRALQTGRALPEKERAQTEPAAAQKEQDPFYRLLDEARRRADAHQPTRRQRAPDAYKGMGPKTADPQEEKDRQTQQELERKLQRERDRER